MTVLLLARHNEQVQRRFRGQSTCTSGEIGCPKMLRRGCNVSWQRNPPALRHSSLRGRPMERKLYPGQDNRKIRRGPALSQCRRDCGSAGWSCRSGRWCPVRAGGVQCVAAGLMLQGTGHGPCAPGSCPPARLRPGFSRGHSQFPSLPALRPRTCRRAIINGILFGLRTDCAWYSLPYLALGLPIPPGVSPMRLGLDPEGLGKSVSG